MGYVNSCFKGEYNLLLTKLTEELGELETKHKKDLNLDAAAKLKEIRKELKNQEPKYKDRYTK